MIIALSIGLILVVLGMTLYIRDSDLPPMPPPNPFKIYDERKARVYENLRDLQFEFRVGKLSDTDYQTAKQGLQKELAQVLAEADALKATLAVEVVSKAPAAKGKSK